VDVDMDIVGVGYLVVVVDIDTGYWRVSESAIVLVRIILVLCGRSAD
jgi:hypothetical protein